MVIGINIPQMISLIYTFLCGYADLGYSNLYLYLAFKREQTHICTELNDEHLSDLYGLIEESLHSFW